MTFILKPKLGCTHGGASFEAIGDDFQTLDRRHGVVAADVLDAWFPPAPQVIEKLQEHLSWLVQTSPPADSAGVINAISDSRGISTHNLIAGAGSSSLMYLALRSWLTTDSRVLLPDPTYSEYEHLFTNVIGCRLDRLVLTRSNCFSLDTHELHEILLQAELEGDPYDLVVLVNPNNPTGCLIPRNSLEPVVSSTTARFWIDEAYIDYCGSGASMEPVAASAPNVVVCKSLSKCYALSGVRAAYLCGPSLLMDELRAISPPWNVSLVAQVAAVEALRSESYYAQRYGETVVLRNELAERVRAELPEADVVSGAANWLMCYLPEIGPDAAEVRRRCIDRHVYLRDAASVSDLFGSHTLRISVKTRAENELIVSALEAAVSG